MWRMNKKTIILKLLIPFFLVGCSSKGSSNDSVSASISSSEAQTSSVSDTKSSNTSDVRPSTTSENKPSSANESKSSSTSESKSSNTSSATQSSSSFNSASSSSMPSISVPDYVLHGLYYGENEWTDKQMVINPYSTTEYMIQGVSLHENDEFKIHMYGETWYGYSAIKSSVKSGLVTAASSNDNIKVRVTGVYDIYCDYNESDNGHIYISKVENTSTNVGVSGISLSNTGKYLLTRNEFTITATVYPDNATNKEIRWTSSDESIATVSGGRVVAKEKKGSTTITAKTVDGNYTATCLVYVSPSQYPEYCLTGTVGGRSYSYLNTKYAAIPLSTGKYLIPDVDLVAGDELTVMNNQGSRLMNKSNQVYKKAINKNMSVNVYLDVNDANKDYLSLVTKSNNS